MLSYGHQGPRTYLDWLSNEISLKCGVYGLTIKPNYSDQFAKGTCSDLYCRTDSTNFGLKELKKLAQFLKTEEIYLSFEGLCANDGLYKFTILSIKNPKLKFWGEAFTTPRA